MDRDLVVVIATANRGGLLRRTLASLAECSKPASYRETVIIENGAKTGAEDIIRSYHSSLKTRYLYAEQPNKSGALNAALEVVGDCLVFFTDDDVRVHPNTLCAYADAARGVHRRQYYGGPTRVDYQSEPADWLKAYLPPSARGWYLENNPGSGKKTVFLGCNWAAYVCDIKDAGGFNSRFGPGALTGSTGQEANMQTRLWERGVKPVYVPEAMVWHYVPQEACSPKWIKKRAYRYGVECGMKYIYEGPRILGFPRWTIRALMKKSLAIALRSTTGGVQDRLHANYNFFFTYGYMWGSRISHTEVAKSD